MSHHDVIVVGIGMAGLTAATKLAESGARVGPDHDQVDVLGG